MSGGDAFVEDFYSERLLDLHKVFSKAEAPQPDEQDCTVLAQAKETCPLSRLFPLLVWNFDEFCMFPFLSFPSFPGDATPVPRDPRGSSVLIVRIPENREVCCIRFASLLPAVPMGRAMGAKTPATIPENRVSGDNRSFQSEQ